MTAAADLPLPDDNLVRLPANELYDGSRRAFNPGRLRKAMVMRGLGIDDLAAKARLGRSTVVIALHGDHIRDRSAAQIIDVLSRVRPKEVE